MSESDRIRQKELLEFIKNNKNDVIIDKSKNYDNTYNLLFTENPYDLKARSFTFQISNTADGAEKIIPSIRCTDESNSEIELNEDELKVVFEHVINKKLTDFKGLNSVMTLGSMYYAHPDVPLFCSKIGKTEDEEGGTMDMPNNLTEVVGKALVNAKLSSKKIASVLVSCSWLDNKDLNGEVVPELKQHMVTMAVNCEKFDAYGKLKDNQKLDSESCLIFDNSNAIENLPDDIKGQFQTILDCENGNLSSFYPDKRDYGEKVKGTICFFCARESYIQMSTEKDVSIDNRDRINGIANGIAESIKQKYTDVGLIELPHVVETQNLPPETPRPRLTNELTTGVSDRISNFSIPNNILEEYENVQQATPLQNCEPTEQGIQDLQTLDQKQTENSYKKKSEKEYQSFISQKPRWNLGTKKSEASKQYILNNKEETEGAEGKRKNSEINQRSGSRVKSSYGYRDIFKFKSVN